MKWNQVKHEWPFVQAAVKRTWGRIDEADLALIHGDRDSFITILAQRYGYDPLDAQQKLDAFVDQLDQGNDSRSGLTWLSRLSQKCWGHIHVTRRL